MGVVSFKGSLLLMAFLIHTVLTAPVIEENTELLGPDQIAEGKGCYYNYEHYDEGDRILTNEPCLNCTCHNRMLMCYLRVCPFTKAIGQDCKVEKKPDQCCPVITCPQVPVALLTSSTTETTASTTTAVGHPDSYGCVLDDSVFYADGAQVPSDPRKPCELCYCIRNQTACVMQECTLNVEGCKPVYQEGVCCPVRYDCDYDEVLTTPGPTAGLITTPGGPNECKANDRIYQDGEMINNMTTNPCEHCYCMRGDVVCAVQECGTPLENTECTPMPAEPGQCCPSTYQCPNGTVPAHVLQATPNLKPSPPVVPSLAHIKPDTETEKPTADDKIVEDSETAHDGQESENAGVEQHEPEKTVGPSDSTVAESSEVITEAPKDVAIIEIITTAAPQDASEAQTEQSTNEALQTDVEQHPEAQHEISSVPEIIPEHDQVEEGHVEEEHVQEGQLEDGQGGEGHDVEATTAPGLYTEISVENVEMNTSPPEKAKPEIPSASHILGEDEPESMNTEVPQELTTVGPSSPLVEQLPQNENQEVSNQQLEHDGSVQPESQDKISQPEHQDEISQPEHQDEISQPEHQDEISQPEHQDEISQPEHQDEISQPEHQDEISQPEHQDEISQPEHQDEISQPEHQEATNQDVNQQTTIQPDVQESSIQPEIQETTIRPEIQEVINQLDNQGASSQQENLEALQPEYQDPSTQQVNQESSSQQEIIANPTEISPSTQQVSEESSSQKEIVASPTESAPSSQVPQEPLPEANEKLSAAHDLPETTPAPVSTTTTTEAEPIEMSRIPGEGSCLHKGITYAPNTDVPSENPCKRCKCINSIVECKDPECPEPPITLYSNCIPMPPTDDACCPTYFCEQNPSQEPEVDSMSIDKIDQEVEEGASEEGIAPTTVASVHEDVPVVPELFVPGTHEISDYTHNVEDGAQPESPVSEDVEETKPSGEGLQPESVIPSGEGSEQQSAIPPEGSQPESVVPSEAPQPESVPVESVTEPQSPVDAASVEITTPLPEAPSDHQGPTIDQHEESPAVATEDVHPVSQDNVESESAHDANVESESAHDANVESVPAHDANVESVSAHDANVESESAHDANVESESAHDAEGSTVSTEVIPEEQGGKLEEAQSNSEVAQTTAVDEQQIVTERPQQPAAEQVSFDGSNDAQPISEHSLPEVTAEGSTAQPEIEKPHEITGSQDALPTNENLEETIETTVTPPHEDITNVENGQEMEPQHGDLTNPEESNAEGAHDGQESVTEVESSVSGAVSTDAPNVPIIGEHEGAEHDSEPSGSSQPIEAEVVPTIDQSENDLTATHDQSAPESPTTAIPEEASSVHAEYNEALLPSTEGPFEASENPQTPEPMVTAGPPVLFPDISHQGAPIHIPGPTGINTDGLTSEDERLGQTEAPVQEPSQTEQPPAPEESFSSGDVQQASEGEINGDVVYTTEGLNAAVSHQTEETANEVGSGNGTEDNQITESSQTSEPNVHDDVNEILPHEPPLSGDRHVEEVKEPEGEQPSTQVSQSVTETSQEQVQHHGETEAHLTHEESEVPPAHDDTVVPPAHDDTEVPPAHDDTEVPAAHDDTEVPAAHDDTEVPPAHDDTEIPAAHDDTEVPAAHDDTEVPPAHDDTEVPPAHDDTEIPAAHDDTEVPAAHGDTEVPAAHDDTEAQQTHDDTEPQPTQDELGAQQTHDGSEAHTTHDESEALPTHEETLDKTETHEQPAEQVVTEAPSIPEQGSTEMEAIATEAPQGPVVTHGDLPTPSEPSADNVILPHSENEPEEQPEPSQTLQPQDTEVSASQPAGENQQHEKVESESEHPQQVTQAPENDEVVTHIDSAGPQQIPEIANQVVETETNAIEHATGLEHGEEPSAPSEDGKPGTGEVDHAAEEHHEPIEQEQPPQTEEPQSIPEEPQSIPEEPQSIPEEPQSIPEEPQSIPEKPQSIPQEPQSIPEEHHTEAVPAEHEQQPDVVPAEHQEHPESEHVPILEDHSEGHNGPLLEENQEQQTEQPASGGLSEQTQSEPQPPEMAQTEVAQPESSTQLPEHTNAGEAQSEPQEETVQTLPEVTHDENQPEQPLVEEHLEQQEPHPEQTHIDDAGVSHSDVAEQEQPQTNTVPELPGPPQDTEVTPEQQNVISGQQAEKDEAQVAVSEHQELPEVTGDVQETVTEQEHGSGLPSTDGQVSHIEENQDQVPLTSHDSAPAATGEEGAQTAAPSTGEMVHTEEVTPAPEQPEGVGETAPAVEAEKDGGHALETNSAVLDEDQQQIHEELTTPEGQPNEPIALSPESGPSGSDLPTTAAEEVPAESAPSAPSAPESAPSASESVVPEEPSAPESIVPEQPSAPESVVPEQPSAPEYTAPEQTSGPESEAQPSAPESEGQPSAPESEGKPSAPEQPVAPETQPSSLGQDEVPAPQESDIPSQPDQSSHLVEEIEKEQPAPETTSSPIAELAQSSPLPPVEIPSTEGPVLPPGLQTWSQKPYHPPSLPEHQQHHQTAEVPHLPEDSHYPSQPYDQDYEDDDNVSYGPGTCRYGGKVYLSAQQIPRDDPCDFCFCFRSDIICLQQSCPPPIRGCYQETIKGFCCPRYECHVSMATMVNITTTSTTTTTTVPPHFLSHHYNGSAMKAGCQVKGIAYRVGDRIPSTSGPCLDCRCGADGQMKCDPTVCGPQESLLRQVMAASVSKRRRR